MMVALLVTQLFFVVAMPGVTWWAMMKTAILQCCSLGFSSAHVLSFYVSMVRHIYSPHLFDAKSRTIGGSTDGLFTAGSLTL